MTRLNGCYSTSDRLAVRRSHPSMSLHTVFFSFLLTKSFQSHHFWNQSDPHSTTTHAWETCLNRAEWRRLNAKLEQSKHNTSYPKGQDKQKSKLWPGYTCLCKQLLLPPFTLAKYTPTRDPDSKKKNNNVIKNTFKQIEQSYALGKHGTTYSTILL